MDIALVEPGLWVGSRPDVVPPGVHCVVNLTEGGEAACHRARGAYVRYLFAPIPDGAFRGIPWLDSTVDTIIRWRREGLSVLVHCAAGLSRAPTVVAAVMMKTHGWTRDEALAAVRRTRPQVNPNPHFMAGLAKYGDWLKTRGNA